MEGTGWSWARPWGLLLLLGARAGHAQLLQGEGSLSPVSRLWPGCRRVAP